MARKRAAATHTLHILQSGSAIDRFVQSPSKICPNINKHQEILQRIHSKVRLFDKCSFLRPCVTLCHPVTVCVCVCKQSCTFLENHIDLRCMAINSVEKFPIPTSDKWFNTPSDAPHLWSNLQFNPAPT